MSSRGISPYYRDSSVKFSLASSLSYATRKRIFNLFMAVMEPTSDSRVLDIGVTSDVLFKESNFFEQFYPFKQQIVCVGTEDGAHLEGLYPGLRFVQIRAGQRLPFSDKQFDIVFSNAVIEHAGNSEDQLAFLADACRVGKRVFVTTPNRWFPVEHHTAVPLLHYLPKRVYRSIIGRTHLRYWSHEKHLNLLTKREFAGLFPSGYPVKVGRVGIAFGPFKSNLVAYTSSF